MAQYTLDLTNYRPSISDTIDEGRYLAVVESYEQGRSKANNDMFTVYLRVVEGPFEGATIIDRLAITDKALFKIVGFLTGLGFPTPKKRLSINPQAWVNRKVWIDTSVGEPYRGRPGTSQVDGYARFIPENDRADAPAVEELPELPEESIGEPVAAEDVKAFETTTSEPTAEVVEAPTEEAPQEAGGEASSSPSVADRVKAASTPKSAEPETLSLADIDL